MATQQWAEVVSGGLGVVTAGLSAWSVWAAARRGTRRACPAPRGDSDAGTGCAERPVQQEAGDERS
ncbi:hypothetical protein ACFY4C_39635 [Actinomadura viridis]|uniref:hypothetical protein n=1 Tax=Actinomadura viridis TaxID=58110 RepID=UPI00368D1EC5